MDHNPYSQKEQIEKTKLSPDFEREYCAYVRDEYHNAPTKLSFVIFSRKGFGQVSTLADGTRSLFIIFFIQKSFLATPLNHDKIPFIVVSLG
ncbi:MAG TPA: hypothetical protein VKA95_17560 [Nitrososphaeraceae archaeon]|nr:hypothetical protein [Nitrososphaeraceae archaeon]